MKLYKTSPVPVILLIGFLGPVTAQQKSQRPAQTPTPVERPSPLAPAATATDGKIAIIYSAVFTDEKRGIARFINAVKELDRQFEPYSSELRTMKENLRPVSTETEELIQLNDPDEIHRRWKARVESQKQYDSRSKKVKAAYDERYEEVIKPLMDQIGKAVADYARERGFSLVIDVSNSPRTFYVLNNSLDITSDFIADYNRHQGR